MVLLYLGDGGGGYMKAIGLYAGTFDPLTKGHMYVIKESLKIFDKIYVGVATHPNKQPMFSQTQRRDIILDTFRKEIDTGVLEVVDLNPNKYTILEACRLNCTHLIRGIRNGTDTNNEFVLMEANEHIFVNLEDVLETTPSTIWIPTDSTIQFLSSSFVKSLMGFEGWETLIRHYVPVASLKAMVDEYNNQNDLPF